jgi:patatin-related protein
MQQTTEAPASVASATTTATSTVDHQPRSDFAKRELRLAVVMTGGVSLAVWIGGVAAEIHRAVRGEGVYGSLNRALRTSVEVDVIAGASAGGVNGAFLATAIAYPVDDLLDDRFDGLLSTWRETGAFLKLLRKAGESNPASLLQGDAFFLPELGKAINKFIPANPDCKVEPDELRLVMTTTMLKPQMIRYTDDLGTPLFEPVNAATFEFDGDSFRDGRIAARLALAARSSASFPGAFEPSFIPIGVDGDTLHPDMATVASFSESRWVVDGGVLMNKPVAPAMEGIRDRVAQSEVRRVLLYVNPDPSDGPMGDRQADAEAEMPTFVSVVTKSVFGLPQTESIAADLKEIAASNSKLSMQRSTRAALLLGLRVCDRPKATDDAPVSDTARSDSSAVDGSWRVEQVDVVALATNAYPLWLRKRAYRSVEKRLALLGTDGNDPDHSYGQVDWVEFARQMRFERGRRAWLSSHFPVASDGPTVGAGLDLRSVGVWRFGLEPIEYMCSVTLDLVRQAYALLPAQADEDALHIREELGKFRKAIHDQRRLIKALRGLDDYYWRCALAALKNSDAYEKSCRSMFDRWPMVGGPETEPDTYAVSDPTSPRKQLSRAVALLKKAGASTSAEWATTTAETLRTPTADVPWSEILKPSDEDRLAARGAETTVAGHFFRRAELEIARHLAGLLRQYESMLLAAAAIGGAAVESSHRGQAPDGATEATSASVEATPPEVLRGSVRRILGDDSSARTDAELIQFLLALYIVQDMADNGVEDREVRVDFVQISADNASPLSGTLNAADKVAGLQLSHFGGFLKETWRANDWMWGTVDGAARLVDVLVEGNRIRQCLFTLDKDSSVATASRVLYEIATTGHAADTQDPPNEDIDAADIAFLQSRVKRDKIEKEMKQLFERRNSSSLSYTRASIGLTVQLLCARREIPKFVEAIKQSTKDGAFESRSASKLVAEYEELKESHRRLSLADAQHLTLVIQDIGRERLQAEYGSDAMSATIAQTASVLGNLLAGDQVGVSFVRRPLKVVRYGLRALSLSMTSAIAQTRTSTAFRNLLLAAVGVCVALVVLGVHLPTPLSVSAVVAAGLWLVLTVNGYLTQLFIALATVATVLVMLGSDTAPQVFSGESGDTTRWTIAIAAVALFGVAAIVELIRQWLSTIPEQSTSDRFRRVAVSVVLVAGAGYLIASPLRRGLWRGGLSGHLSLIVWVALAAIALWFSRKAAPKIVDTRHRVPKLSHGGHSIVIAAFALSVFWLIRWITVGEYRLESERGGSVNPRERFIDVVGRAHDVRWLLVLGIPALIVGVDLLAGWVKNDRLSHQRSAAAAAAQRADTAAASKPEI